VQVVFELPHSRADGATHLLLDALELIEKLTLLIPPPRFHTLRCHGVLALHAPWRSAVIPGRPEAEEEGPPAAVGSPRERASRWRRCCAGCSPWTSLRVRVAAAGGGSWACTPGASRCGPCASAVYPSSPRVSGASPHKHGLSPMAS